MKVLCDSCYNACVEKEKQKSFLHYNKKAKTKKKESSYEKYIKRSGSIFQSRIGVA